MLTQTMPISPETIMQLGSSYMPARILLTSVQLGVFTHIFNGCHSLDSIAKAAKASARGMRMLLDSLCTIHLLNKKDNEYYLNNYSEKFLVKQNPDYIGAIMETDWLWQAWGNLTDVVKSGKPFTKVDSKEKGQEFFPVLIKSLHVLNWDLANKLVENMGLNQSSESLNVLDLACGTAVWSIPLAIANSNVKVVAQDFPAIIKVTQEYVKKHNVESQYSYLEGDLRDLRLSENSFDIIYLGNIIHSEGEKASYELLKKLFLSLKTGGKIIIIDMITNEDHTEPGYPVLFALNMLVNTVDGDTFSLGEYTQWLNDIGYSKIETVDINSHSPVIIAHKLS